MKLIEFPRLTPEEAKILADDDARELPKGHHPHLILMFKAKQQMLESLEGDWDALSEEELEQEFRSLGATIIEVANLVRESRQRPAPMESPLRRKRFFKGFAGSTTSVGSVKNKNENFRRVRIPA
jgi:hypothetical protein